MTEPREPTDQLGIGATDMTDRTHPDSGRTTGGIVEMLQDRVAELESQLEAIGAGGVEPLRSRCLHQIAEPAVSSQQDNSREDASYASLSLAEMVLSDCGHSSNYTPLFGCGPSAIKKTMTVDRLLKTQAACTLASGAKRNTATTSTTTRRRLPIGRLCCGGWTPPHPPHLRIAERGSDG